MIILWCLLYHQIDVDEWREMWQQKNNTTTNEWGNRLSRTSQPMVSLVTWCWKSKFFFDFKILIRFSIFWLLFWFLIGFTGGYKSTTGSLLGHRHVSETLPIKTWRDCSPSHFLSQNFELTQQLSPTWPPFVLPKNKSNRFVCNRCNGSLSPPSFLLLQESVCTRKIIPEFTRIFRLVIFGFWSCAALAILWSWV